MIGVNPSARSSLTAIGRRRLDRVGDHHHAAGLAVPADRDRRLALGLCPPNGLNECDWALREQPLPPDHHFMRLDGTLNPEPPQVGEILCCRKIPILFRAPVAIAFAIGCSDDCSSAPASRSNRAPAVPRRR